MLRTRSRWDWRAFLCGNQAKLKQEGVMDSAMIGKIEKAIRYAQERDRFEFQQFTVRVQGTHRAHVVSFNCGQWSCGCDFFANRGRCSHTIALEKLLGEMLPGAIPMVMS
jgi:hypothetical protein